MDGVQGKKVSSQRKLSINTLQSKFEKCFIAIFFERKSECVLLCLTRNYVFASEEWLGPTQTSKMESIAAMAKIRQLLFQRSQS